VTSHVAVSAVQRLPGANSFMAQGLEVGETSSGGRVDFQGERHNVDSAGCQLGTPG
jgi:hypothetical protein